MMEKRRMHLQRGEHKEHDWEEWNIYHYNNIFMQVKSNIYLGHHLFIFLTPYLLSNRLTRKTIFKESTFGSSLPVFIDRHFSPFATWFIMSIGLPLWKAWRNCGRYYWGSLCLASEITSIDQGRELSSLSNTATQNHKFSPVFANVLYNFNFHLFSISFLHCIALSGMEKK